MYSVTHVLAGTSADHHEIVTVTHQAVEINGEVQRSRSERKLQDFCRKPVAYRHTPASRDFVDYLRYLSK